MAKRRRNPATPSSNRGGVERPASTAPARRDGLAYLALVLVTVSVFAQVQHFEFVDFDDLDYVADNVHVTSGLTANNIAWAFSHAYEHTGGPLTWISYMVDSEIGGVSSRTYHVTNLALHTATVCLLFGAFSRMTGSRWASLFVALVFAIHPLHVESVAWIAERKDVLSGFFAGVTLAAYARYVGNQRWWSYAAVFVAFVSGLMAKPILVTLPLLLLCLDFWPLQRLGSSRRVFVEKIPLLIAAGVVAVLTVGAQQTLGAMSSLDTTPMSVRLQTAVVSYGWYLLKMVWPSNLAAFYPMSMSVPIPAVAGALAVVLLFTWCAWRSVRSQPFLAAGWFWYVLALAPVSGIVQTGAHARADRNTYLSMIGIAIMIAWTFERLARSRPQWAKAIAAAGCLFIAAQAVVAHRQTGYWKSSETLFRRAVEVTNGNYVALTGLATALRRGGELEGPVGLFQQALAIAPRYAPARGGLGEALMARGEVKAALSELDVAIGINPNVAEFHVNRGSALSAAGRAPEAVLAFQRALSLDRGRADIHSGLGAALAMVGDVDRAVLELREAVRLDATDADAHFNLGVVLSRIGHLEEAVTHLSEAVRLKPGVPEFERNLQLTLKARGKGTSGS